MQDVTERRALEQRVHQAQKMEAIGRLAAGVAHDFNNLLTVILSYGELLLDQLEPGSSQCKQAMQIQAAAERARSLTAQLLAYSRKQVIEPKVLHLNDIVASLEGMLRRLIGANIELATDLNPTLGQVKADWGQLEQILFNLAANARDAMPQGGKLFIQTRNAELDDTFVRGHLGSRPGAYAMLAVGDTGTGIDSETQAHIFEPFFTTKEKGKGTGLGLASVYGIVKQNGGYIAVDSRHGQGTTFEVYLPRVNEPVESVRPPSKLDRDVHGFETVLVAEDNDGIRDLTRECLEHSGYTVLTARDGQEALKTSEQHDGTIHLFLTDVVMPGMVGSDVARQLRHLRPETKVLYMSGYADSDIISRGVLESGVTFLQKPFTPDSLLVKIRDVLDGRG